MELRDLLTTTQEGREEPIRTGADWQEKREQIRQGFLEIAGAFPEKQVALNTEWLEAFDCGPYVRHKVRYSVEPDDCVPAYLLVPKKTGRMPAVLALHGSAGHSQNWGKDWPAGIPLDLRKYADTKIGADRMETHYIARRVRTSTGLSRLRGPVSGSAQHGRTVHLRPFADGHDRLL